MKTLALAKKEGEPFVEATKQKAANGEYPLAKIFLYIYVNKVPNKPLPPLEAQFLKMVTIQDRTSSSYKRRLCATVSGDVNGGVKIGIINRIVVAKKLFEFK